MNLCRSCGEDFSSVSNFDRHRVGDHALDWPAHDDGRRCLTVDELVELGLERNARGHWHDPKDVERVRATFGAA